MNDYPSTDKEHGCLPKVEDDDTVWLQQFVDNCKCDEQHC